MAYLESYLASISGLPAELYRKFNLMHDLDVKCQSIITESERLGEGYLKMSASARQSRGQPLLDDVRSKHKEAMDLSEEKVQIALQTYDEVDKHIRRLDDELRKFEKEMQKDEMAVAGGSGALSAPLPTGGNRRVNVSSSSSSSSAASSAYGMPATPIPPVGKGRQSFVTPPARQMIRDMDMDDGMRRPFDERHKIVDSDMPVDPNEPLYCYCQRVSFGEMVACDNQDCQREWFHFECVGLTAPPRGKWFCPSCEAQRKV